MMNETAGKEGEGVPRWTVISHIVLMLMWVLLVGEQNDEFQTLEVTGNLDKSSSGEE